MDFDPTPIVLETPVGFPEMPVSEQNPLTEEGVYLGRKLFYDPILSRDGTFSCASCHKQEFAFSAGEKLSAGVNGDSLQRNVPGLFNLAWYPQLFWDGRSNSIEEQVFEPVRNHQEMDLDWSEAVRRLDKNKEYKNLFKKVFGTSRIDSTKVALAIAQFERTLVSANSKFDRVLRGEAYFSPSEYRGYVLVNSQVKGNCLHCHTSDANALGTTGELSNNGLQVYDPLVDDAGRYGVTGKKEDLGKFKIPSLRNLVFTAPYMHDGRFETLEEVVDFYSEKVVESTQTDSKIFNLHTAGIHLTDEEKSDIVNFLKTMSDSSFVVNPAYSKISD